MEVTMETKSRYQVIAELEEKKNSLIRERDATSDTIKIKDMEILNMERQIEDIKIQKEDFALQMKNKEAEIKRESEDFEFKIKNTESIFNRNLEDAKANLEHFKSQEKEKKETLNELIKGVDDSLERFNNLQSKK